MKIFRHKKNQKLYYIEQVVRSMCLCAGNKHYAHPYNHTGKRLTIGIADISKKFEVVAESNKTPRMPCGVSYW